MLLRSICLQAVLVAGFGISVVSPHTNDREPVPAAKGNFTEYELPTPRSGPSVVVIDRDDTVWVALARAGKIGHFRAGVVTEYALPAQAFPVGLAIDNGGNIWFSDIRRNKIGRLDPRTRNVRDYDIPTAESWPFFIVITPDGHLWFSERLGNNIGRLNPTTGRIDEFPVPTKHAQPAGMTVTPDGDIFFTENSGNKIGRINPRTASISEYAVPTPMTPSPFYGLAGIASDRSGNVWFAEVDGLLGLIRSGSATVEEIRLPTPNVRPAGVAIDAWQRVWYTELDGNCISSYDPKLGKLRRYLIPTGAPDQRPMGPPEVTARGELPAPGAAARTSRPFGIALDSRGQVWFSQQYGHKLGTLRPELITVFEPSGLVTDARAPVVVQHRLTGAELRYRLNGQPTSAGAWLDVTRLKPGRHTLTVDAVLAGRVHSASTSFLLSPSTIQSVFPLLNHVAPGEMPSASRDAFLKRLRAAEASIEAGETGPFREVVRDMLVQATAPGSRFAPMFADLVSARLRHLDQFASREYTVRIAGSGVRPERLLVEVGDSVRFVSHGPAPSGDALKPHVLASADGEFRSAALGPQASWAHTFVREGTYEYRCTEHPNVRGRVVVGPRTTHIVEFPLAGPARVPGVLAVDAADNIWFTAGGGGFSRLTDVPLNNRLGRISARGEIREYQTPTIDSAPTSIHVDQKGDVWFTERAGNNIGRLNPETGVVSEYPLPTPLSGATGITVAPDGRVWFAAKLVSKIGVLDPVTGLITEYDTPSPKSEPSTIVAEESGDIWFDERANDRIVRFTPSTGVMKEYAVPTPRSRVVGLVPDPRGYVWFLQLAGNKVGRLDKRSGSVVEYSIPTPQSTPFKLALDGDGRVWFTQVFGNKVGVLDNGRFYEFEIPTRDSMPGGIVIDSRGHVWFSQQAGNKIAMIPHGARKPTVNRSLGTLTSGERQ